VVDPSLLVRLAEWSGSRANRDERMLDHGKSHSCVVLEVSKGRSIPHRVRPTGTDDRRTAVPASIGTFSLQGSSISIPKRS